MLCFSQCAGKKFIVLIFFDKPVSNEDFNKNAVSFVWIE